MSAMSNGKDKAGEEDLDDLDDVLDQFTKPELPAQTKSTAPPPSASASGSQSLEADAAFREAWVKMILQDLEGKGKEDELDTSLGRGDDQGNTHTKEHRKDSGDGMQEMSEEEDPFQKAVRHAMEKLQDSDDTLKLNEEDAESSENVESMLETMMSQLMSKDILYEPLKELDTKYPHYIAQNASSLPRDDLCRYTDQKARVSQIIAIFEDPLYSDDNAAQSTQILQLMSEMQSYGSPPSEIMGPMPPGFELGIDGMPQIPDGCILL